MPDYVKRKSNDKEFLIQVYRDFERSAKKRSKLRKEMEKDFEFAQGKQWEDDDVATLRGRGVKALTINKIRPIIKLITGIERQSRTDYVAYPEGQEDGLIADITTALLKNVVKCSKAERKLSEQFKRGMIGGEDYLEPYMDYSQDLLHGELKIKNVSPFNIFPDPDAEEYDLSDAKYLIKFQSNLSKDQVLELFPDKEKELESIGFSKVNIDSIDKIAEHIQGVDYPALSEGDEGEDNEKGYDLIEYYYKEPVDRYFIIDREMQTVIEAETKEKAQVYQLEYPNAQVIRKKIPQICLAQVIGDKILTDDICWSYPRWKSFPIIPFFAEWLTIDIKDRDLLIQGLVRSLKDLQEEYNKRRSQELQHLNSTVNSGIMYPKGSLDQETKHKIKKYGSSPGIEIEYDASVGKPEKIFPTPLSQGHAQMAEESAEDLKQASGVNPDLLANTESDQSGRAILLKQKQGLVMVQEMLDNYSDTKKLLGKFLLSQLGEIFTVETAIKVVGEAFLQKYQEFQKPVMGQVDPLTGQPVPNIDPMTGQPQTEVDPQMVGEIFNKVLNDSSLGKYDVSIGEGAYSETVKISNHLMLMDMASKGIPIPPDVLVQESNLPEGTKKQIVAAIEQARVAQAQAVQTAGAPQGEKDE